jgi:integrase
VFLRGVRKTKVFKVKAQATAWATQTEADILAGKDGQVAKKTFGQLLEEYEIKVCPTHKGARWEKARIGLVLRDDIAKVKLADLDASHVAEWRDRRLASVSPASVRREWNLLSSACNIAVKEWKWIRVNPMTEVKRPPPTKARERMATDDEIERLLFVMGDDLSQVGGRLGMAFRLALETGMRAGEIAALRKPEVYADYLTVLDGKTMAAARDVPLTTEARRVLAAMPDGDTLFGLTSSQIDSNFRKYKKLAAVDGLHFHDSRANACTKLAKKLNILALARAIGHRDLKQLQVYYRESASDMAKLLD